MSDVTADLATLVQTIRKGLDYVEDSSYGVQTGGAQWALDLVEAELARLHQGSDNLLEQHASAVRSAIVNRDLRVAAEARVAELEAVVEADQRVIAEVSEEARIANERVAELEAERDKALRNERHMRNLHDWRAREGDELRARVRVLEARQELLEAVARAVVSLDAEANEVRRQYAEGGSHGVRTIEAVNVADRAHHLAKTALRALDADQTAAPVDPPPWNWHSYEGMVTVYDWNGNYRGCLGVQRWERLLREDAGGQA